MQIIDANGNIFGNGLEITGPDGKPKTSGGGGSPTGPAGGDLSGSYPNPGVVWNNGIPTYDLQYYSITNPSGFITSATAAATYQPLLTLTTTGSSGPATLTGSTLNIPQYGGSSSLTVGTTAIASGTVGRILFEGTGNVLQQSANLFWDNTNSRLGIGTSSPTAPVNIVGGTETFAGYQRSLWLKTSTNAKSSVELILENTFTTTGRMYEIASYSDGSFNITDRTNSGLRFKIDNTYVQFHSSAAANANLIGTVATINALWFNQTSATATTSNYTLCNSSGLTLLNAPTGGSIYFRIGNSNKALLTNGGNLLLNTTTDAGFKLDVNGTARVQNAFTANGKIFAYGNSTTGISGLGPGLVVEYNSGRGRLFSYDYGAGVSSPISIGENSSIVYIGAYNAAYTSSINIIGSTTIDGDINFIKSTGNILHQYNIGGSIKFILGINSTLNGYQIFNNTTNNRPIFLPQVSGNVIINGTTDITSAQLQITSTTKGFLPPRMTNAQMLAIATPAAGLVVYDTTNNKHVGYDGTAWQNFY